MGLAETYELPGVMLMLTLNSVSISHLQKKLKFILIFLGLFNNASPSPAMFPLFSPVPLSAAVALQRRMCCHRALNDPKNYLENYVAAQLRGKTRSGRPVWTAPLQN